MPTHEVGKKIPSGTSSPPSPTHALPLQHMRRRPPSPNILLQMQPPHLRIPRLAIHKHPQDPLDFRICQRSMLENLGGWKKRQNSEQMKLVTCKSC